MSVQATIERYFACVNAEDWSSMRAIWHEDAELRAVGARPRHGVEEVIGYFSRLFDPWREHRDEPVRVIPAGDTVTVEVRFEGATRDGRAVGFDAVDVFDLQDDRIRRLSNWYDVAYARKMLAPAGA